VRVDAGDDTESGAAARRRHRRAGGRAGVDAKCGLWINSCDVVVVVVVINMRVVAVARRTVAPPSSSRRDRFVNDRARRLRYHRVASSSDDGVKSSSSSSSDEGVKSSSSSTAEALAREAALEAQRAKAAVTRRAIANAVESRKRAEAEALAKTEAERKEQKRAECETLAKEIGGREPFQRKAGPIFASALATAVAAYASYEFTVHAGDFISAAAVPVESALVASGPAKSGLLSLVVGVGLTLTSSLCFSTTILLALAFNETKAIVTNTPIIYYRCDGADPTCCVNGPHNLGYHERFVYMNHGRGFETRRAQCMQRHLRVSKGCHALKPLIVYPKEEKWGFW